MHASPTSSNARPKSRSSRLRSFSASARARARRRLLDGFVTAALIDEIERTSATLLALGTHGHHRATEILIGGPAGELLHKAPCSVLLARPAPAIDAFPRLLVVGLDGSPQADQALTVAQQLAARFDSSLRAITALKDKHVDLPHVHLRTPYSEAVNQQPAKALVDASDDADLVVVGSRGLHGLRALGSVSERVAHQAACSVLVVRVPSPAGGKGESGRAVGRPASPDPTATPTAQETTASDVGVDSS